MILVDSLTSFTCKRFSRHVAMGTQPLEGGLYGKVQFWVHWAICPFCRRYWNEVNAIDDLNRATLTRQKLSAGQLAEIKVRLKNNMLKTPQ